MLDYSELCSSKQELYMLKCLTLTDVLSPASLDSQFPSKEQPKNNLKIKPEPSSPIRHPALKKSQPSLSSFPDPDLRSESSFCLQYLSHLMFCSLIYMYKIIFCSSQLRKIYSLPQMQAGGASASITPAHVPVAQTRTRFTHWGQIFLWPMFKKLFCGSCLWASSAEAPNKFWYHFKEAISSVFVAQVCFSLILFRHSIMDW